MKLSTYILTVCLGFCSLSLLSGCVMLSKGTIADGSTDYNKVVEKAQNEMLLLNIVRASKRSPMYFTDFNAMRGNMTYNFQTGGLNIPIGKIGGGLNGSYSITPSAAFTTNPNFDLTLNDSQDFTKGIMTPVSMEIFTYYWEQGWPKEMLLHLFIRRIEKIGADGKVEEENSATNYPPGKKDEFKNFQIKLRELFVTDNCTIVKRSSKEKVGPEISKEKASNLEGLIGLQEAGLKLEPLENDKDKYQLISKKESYGFKCAGSTEELSTEEKDENPSHITESILDLQRRYCIIWVK